MKTDYRSTGAISGIEETIRKLDRLRIHAANLGCEIKPGSRIALYEGQLKRFLEPGYNPRHDRCFDPIGMAHGNRDLFELSFICDVLAPNHPDTLRDVLPELLSGAAVPESDQNHLPRNLQFQFFLAAQIANSGYAITLDEPDTIFIHDKVRLGIAAKRPTTSRQAIRRVREGVEQLAHAGLTGFVAVSLDRLVPAPRPYLFLPQESDTALDDAAKTTLHETFRPLARPIQRIISATTITGVITSLTLVGCVRVPWNPAQTMATLWLPRADDLPEESGLIRNIVNLLQDPLRARS